MLDLQHCQQTMNGLLTLVRLPAARRKLVLRTLPLVAAVRVGLWVLPYRSLRRMLNDSRLPFAVGGGLQNFRSRVGCRSGQPACAGGELPHTIGRIAFYLAHRRAISGISPL
jgi:hypothetical protein